ncbi:MAG: hypothetical protein LBU32_01390 [Clostridiales bacterium]|nr:hypothetical protein [Clostridiales bacterium]
MASQEAQIRLALPALSTHRWRFEFDALRNFTANSVASKRFEKLSGIYRFSFNGPFFKLDYPLSGAIDNGISHSRRIIKLQKRYFSMKISISVGREALLEIHNETGLRRQHVDSIS